MDRTYTLGEEGLRKDKEIKDLEERMSLVEKLEHDHIILTLKFHQTNWLEELDLSSGLLRYVRLYTRFAEKQHKTL